MIKATLAAPSAWMGIPTSYKMWKILDWSRTFSMICSLGTRIGQFEPILWGKTSYGAPFFLVRTKEKITTVLDHKIPQPNYRGCTSCLSIFEHLKKQNFWESKFGEKKTKTNMWNTKLSNMYSVHFIVLPFCVLKQFSLSM